MIYLSNLLNRPVADADGELVGHVEDVIAVQGQAPGSEPVLPPTITALVVKQGRRTHFISYSDVLVLLGPAIALNKRKGDMVAYVPCEHDLHLSRDVLDKQIIDIDGVRVVRVNDVQLARSNGHLYVSCVDIGGLGLLRRIGIEPIAARLATWMRRPLPPGLIPWESLELIALDKPMQLRIPRDRLSQLHPADIAELITDLGRAESGALLRALGAEMAADTLEQVEPELQASLLGILNDEDAADVLEAMSPDEAADLLGELSDEHSQELLELMEDEEAIDVRKLLAYPEDSAGGIMTTEYVAIRPDLSAGQAIAALRASAADEAETFYYVYVTEANGHLLGVFSLQDLVLAQPATPVAEFMHHHAVTVNLLDDQYDIAQIVAKYNLLAVPVVDGADVMHGIVTADDALDKIIPTAWKKRLPRLYA